MLRRVRQRVGARWDEGRDGRAATGAAATEGKTGGRATSAGAASAGMGSEPVRTSMRHEPSSPPVADVSAFASVLAVVPSPSVRVDVTTCTSLAPSEQST